MQNSVLFVAGSIHQGHDQFSDVTRGRQCSFMSFTALLCAQSLPVELWSSTTVDQILIEGDRLYLDALSDGTIPDMETLSLNYLPEVSCLSFIKNDKANGFPGPYELPLRADETSDLPLRANDTQSPVQATNSNPDLPVVEQNREQYSKTNGFSGPYELPLESDERDLHFGSISQTCELPVRANNTQSPVEVTTYSDPSVVEQNKKYWKINYQEFYQGTIFPCDLETGAPYFSLHFALMDAFANHDFAFIILDGYTMSLMKSANDIYLFDSHARNSFGLPDPNGFAVVLKFVSMDHLEHYLCTLSRELHTEMFELVPVVLHLENFIPGLSNENPLLNQTEHMPGVSNESPLLNQSEHTRISRLQKAREYKTKMFETETEEEKAVRLMKNNAAQKRKRGTETAK